MTKKQSLQQQLLTGICCVHRQVVRIITCRFMDASGNGWVSDAIRCIEYCIGKGAHVMSNSWGGVEYSDSLQACLYPSPACTCACPLPVQGSAAMLRMQPCFSHVPLPHGVDAGKNVLSSCTSPRCPVSI